MKKTIYLLGVILLATSILTNCKCKKPIQYSQESVIEATMMIDAPYSVAEAKEDFNNFRKNMGYITASNISKDNENGYFDIKSETLSNLLMQAGQNGWKNLRIYNGIDKNGTRILIVSELNVGPDGKVIETKVANTDLLIKVKNPPLSASGSDCPRWCDVSGTTLGK